MSWLNQPERSRVPQRTGAEIAKVREPERFPHARLAQSSERSLDQLEPGRFQGVGVDLTRLDHGLRAVLHDLQSRRRFPVWQSSFFLSAGL